MLRTDPSFHRGPGGRRRSRTHSLIHQQHGASGNATHAPAPAQTRAHSQHRAFSQPRRLGCRQHARRLRQLLLRRVVRLRVRLPPLECRQPPVRSQQCLVCAPSPTQSQPASGAKPSSVYSVLTTQGGGGKVLGCMMTTWTATPRLSLARFLAPSPPSHRSGITIHTVNTTHTEGQTRDDSPPISSFQWP